MKDQIEFLLTALLLTWMGIWSPSATAAALNVSQNPSVGPKPLDQRINDVDEISHLQTAPWPDKILEICHRNNLPCGVEESPDDPINQSELSTKLGLDWVTSNHTTREVLDAIVSVHPAYRWELIDGVLNIVPKAGHEYRRWWKPILSSHRGHFDVNDMTLRGVGKKACADSWIIWPLPSLSEFFSAFTRRHLTTLVPTGPQVDKVTLHLKNVTVKDILNESVKTDGRAIWLFFYDREQRVYDIHFS
jgi:hypothetical protein